MQFIENFFHYLHTTKPLHQKILLLKRHCEDISPKQSTLYVIAGLTRNLFKALRAIFWGNNYSIDINTPRATN